MENKLSVVIITLNEEKNISEAILSAKFASEITVLALICAPLKKVV